MEFKSKRSVYCTEDSQVLVSDNMSGKMEGIPAISTSCLLNPYCLGRIEKAIESGDKSCICFSCYAKDGLAYKKGLRDNLLQNFELLNSRVLSVDELPTFRKLVEIGRFEAFGDVASVTQCLNYINICTLNPHVVLTAWTKNPNLWDQAFDTLGKPDNLIMVLSSEIVNQPTELYKKYKWVDHVFTVYTLDWLIENGKEIDAFINCGGRHCDSCRRCYTLHNEEFFINELLKSDSKKYYSKKEK